MGRRERHTRDRILGAALRAVASRGAGAVNVAAVQDELGAPVGSIYHRYGSLRHLLAEAWLAAVESFQGGFLAALGGPRAAASGLDAALFTPRWSRSHPLEARILLCCRREDLVSGGWPEEVRERAERLGADLKNGMRQYVRKRFENPTREHRLAARAALIDIPCAVVRPYLEEGRAIDPCVDEIVRRAYRALMKNR